MYDPYLSESKQKNFIQSDVQQVIEKDDSIINEASQYYNFQLKATPKIRNIGSITKRKIINPLSTESKGCQEDSKFGSYSKFPENYNYESIEEVNQSEISSKFTEIQKLNTLNREFSSSQSQTSDHLEKSSKLHQKYTNAYDSHHQQHQTTLYPADHTNGKINIQKTQHSATISRNSSKRSRSKLIRKNLPSNAPSRADNNYHNYVMSHFSPHLVESRITQQFYSSYEEDYFEFIKKEIIRLSDTKKELTQKCTKVNDNLREEKEKNLELYKSWKLQNIPEEKRKSVEQQEKLYWIRKENNILQEQLNYLEDVSKNINTSMTEKFTKHQKFHETQLEKLDQIATENQNEISSLETLLQQQQIQNTVSEGYLSYLRQERQHLQKQLLEETEKCKKSQRKYFSTEPTIKYLQESKEKEIQHLLSYVNCVRHHLDG